MTNIKIYKTIGLLLVIGIIVWFVYAINSILMPFVLSAVLAYLLSPLVNFFETKGLKRIVSALILYSIFLIVFIGSCIILIPQIFKEVSILSNNLPEYTSSIKGSIYSMQQTLEAKYPIIKQKGIFDSTIKNTEQFLNTETSRIPEYLAAVFSMLSIFVLIPFITFFFLLEGKAGIDFVFQKIPPRYTETILSLICEIDEVLGNFFRGQFIESSCVGVLSIIGLLILGVDYAVLIGIVAGMANMIPYLGPFAGAIPALIIGFIKFQNISILIKVVAMFSIVQFIDNNLIQPIILSKGVNLHPVTVIFAIMAGAQVAGVIGMFLSVPIVCIIKATFMILIHRKDLI
ncbi:MAG: AI-2E family transporter [Elusimicrobia bacterium]|nr:AI-2E family transporter [Elusimicrobiota bacterium]MBU2614604.1 AI-2E family transporter [Elusimicrobiota bacterium]